MVALRGDSRMTTYPATPPAPAVPTTPAPWRERTLSRLVTHVRAVLPVSAVAFVTAESGEPADTAPDWLVRQRGSARGDRGIAQPNGGAHALVTAPARGGLGGGTRPGGGDQRPARRGASTAGVGAVSRGVGDRVPGAWRDRQAAGRAGGGLARRDAAIGKRGAADRRSPGRPCGDGARANEPARDGGSPRPRRAAPEARRRGGVCLAGSERGLRARGAARGRDHRWNPRPAHPPQRSRGRAAHGRAGGLLGRARLASSSRSTAATLAR